MEKKLYTCQFCKKEFEPARRKIQKFCSNSCRSKNHHHKNKTGNKTSIEKLAEAFEVQKNKKTKIEKISFAGVGNAALGSIAADTTVGLAKKIFVPENNKPATKGDIQELKDLINTRFFEVHNISPDPYGKIAYFDMSINKIVYFDEYQNKFELPQFNL